MTDCELGNEIEYVRDSEDTVAFGVSKVGEERLNTRDGG